MSEESRVKRWRANKHRQGLKHVSVWLTPEEELCLKDLAILWHCSPSQVVQRALAHIAASAPDDSSPPDALRIRKLILAELAAMGIAFPTVVDSAMVGDTVGPTDTAPPIMYDEKEATAASVPGARAPAFVSDTNVPAYDTSRHYLGKLCPRRHEYHGTGQSLLRKANHLCLACDRERAKERRQAKHAAGRT